MHMRMRLSLICPIGSVVVLRAAPHPRTEGLGSRAADGSGVINVAIVGGAIVPPLTGLAADAFGSLGLALVIPGLCYLVTAAFGLYAARRHTA